MFLKDGFEMTGLRNAVGTAVKALCLHGSMLRESVVRVIVIWPLLNLGKAPDGA